MDNQYRDVSCSIKILVMDVDGTLTDGKVYMSENGELMKAFDIKDGYAINVILPKHNIIPVIITGRESKIVDNRARELNIDRVYQGVKDKLALLQTIADEHSISLDKIAFIGDDLNDLDCIKACGISGCPADAADEVKEHVDFISKKIGGSGAVREFIEFVTKRCS
jgi:3-deoxy-D-manno-octulosonate 8-phosphate phosphatase (KDO 8-P phosphatase)